MASLHLLEPDVNKVLCRLFYKQNHKYYFLIVSAYKKKQQDKARPCTITQRVIVRCVIYFY